MAQFPVPSFDFRGSTPEQSAQANALLRTSEYRNALMGVELEEAKRAQGERNAMLGILKQPGAIDPETGMPTAQVRGQVLQAAPEAGMQMINTLAQMQIRKEQMETNRIHGKLYQAQINDRQAGAIAEAATGLQALYDDLKASNTPPEELNRRLSEAKSDALTRLEKEGSFSESQLSLFKGPFNPQGNLSAIRATREYKTYFDQRQAEERAKRDERRVDQADTRLEQTESRIDQQNARIDQSERRTEGYLSRVDRLNRRGGSGSGSGEGGGDGPGGKGATTLVDPDTGVKYIMNKAGKAWRMDEGEGKWIPTNPNDIPKKAQRMGNVGAAGARESVFTQRVIQAASQAANDLENIVKLPIKSERGPFGTFGAITIPSFLDATKVVLGNKLTTEDQQAYQVMTTGIQRALAQIESSGLMPSGSLTHQMDAATIKPGDTQLTKLHKLAQVRQIVETGMEAVEHNPRISEKEQELVQKILRRVRKAVPFTHGTLIDLKNRQDKDPNMTMRKVMNELGKAKGVSEDNPAELHPDPEKKPATKPAAPGGKKDFSSLWGG